MDEIKNKQVFIVTGSTFLGLPVNGLTIIPAVVHQQHGGNVHCFVKLIDNNQMIITVTEHEIFLNIKDAFDKMNTALLTAKSISEHELDRQSN